jgi:hypothetical protein
MEEIRCTLCGENNPVDAEFCQFCHARLSKLKGSIDIQDSQPIHPGTRPRRRETGELESQLPGWLQRIRQKKEEDELEAAKSGDSDDWLSQIKSQADESPPQPSPPTPIPAAPAEEPGDRGSWLDRIRDSVDQEDPSQLAVGKELAAAKEDKPSQERPDWLERVRARQKEDLKKEPKTPVASQDDFIDRVRAVRDLGIDDAIPAPSEQKVPPRIDEPLGEQAPPEIAEDGPLPDWLDDSQEFQRDHIQSQVEQFEAEETPGDLKPSAPPEAIPIDQQADLPEWLKAEDLPVRKAGPDTEQPIPDWLSQAEPQTPASAPAGADPKLSESGEFPDWLADDKEKAPEEIAPVEGDEGELPDWLADEKQPADAPPFTVEDFEEAGTVPPAPTPGGTVPDWLAKLQEKSPEISIMGAVPDPTPSDEIAFDTGEDLAAPPQQGIPEPAPAELPDWLSEMKARDGMIDIGTMRGVDDDIEIEPAELPSWLQAMRPVASVAPEPQVFVDDMTEESVGPLAGLRGILPAEPEIAQFEKPPVYSLRLNISHSQQKNAELLKELLESEGEERVLSKGVKALPQRLLRLVISIILLLVVSVPILFGTKQVELPSTISPDILGLSEIVSTLPETSSVLLAIEYEPAFSGELDAAAAPIVDHLILRGAQLALISTSPTGPALGERFLSSTQGSHEFQHGEHYVNLGYLAGGTVALRNFALNPKQTSPWTISYEEAWDLPPLANINSLNDFDLVLTITDDPDTGRAWIEQVQPVLGDTPFVMVISAQAEPLIRPYYEITPQQVNGLVTGLSGGAEYEQVTGRSQYARTYWDSFTIGLSAAVVLILLGGLINGITAVISLSRRTPAITNQ